VGRRRSSNQDAYLCDDELGVWMVADGMGGHTGGEVASREATSITQSMLKREQATLMPNSSRESNRAAARRAMERAVQGATYIIYAMGEVDTRLSGMGTTLSILMRWEDLLILGHVGDSRIYRLREGEVEQLSEDHTLVAWQVKKGVLTEEQARRSRKRNVITRAVGNRDHVEVDTDLITYQAGDVFLLCSDGLHGYLEGDELPELLQLPSQAAVEHLVALANERGGRDNITALVLDVSG